jgi:mannose/fructose/N-acetylgalactosamine-specific phosphotransferase system component IIC
LVKVYIVSITSSPLQIHMNSNKIIIALGLGFFLWGFIWSAWLKFPIYPLLLIGICLIITGTGNKKKENEKLSKKE